ncbi:hypothetical protein [Caballeronia sp. LZ016]|uniref:hypothetical protein n=1 Tax=Caballeronia sp. LZ016 TaxID=3038554 RepID=UPI00286524E6|nr:hypothetical protein [Caballeronia sp. LZ016]MDR5739293.1 hypothetical protein [Caballeronia sp. LZ016]
MAFESGLSVTMTGDTSHKITDISAALPGAPRLPSIGATWRLLEDVRTGTIVQVEDADTLATMAYIVRSGDGTYHCAQIRPCEDGYRNALLMAAFRASLPVTVAGDADYYLTALSVGSKAFGPHLSAAPAFISSTPRSGVIDEIMDKEVSDTLIVMVKTPDGTRYHAQIDRQEHANRNNLLLLALRTGLPVTVNGNQDHYVTGIAVGALSAPAAPSLVLFGAKLTDTRSGMLVRIIDSDSLEDIRYVLRTADGAHYCAKMNTVDHPSRHGMLISALARSLPVSISADDDSAITGVAVGLPRAGSPTFRCGTTRFATRETGNIVRMIDSDLLGAGAVYVLQTPDGNEWCVPPLAHTEPARGELLTAALMAGLNVTINGSAHTSPHGAGSVIVERQ